MTNTISETYGECLILLIHKNINEFKNTNYLQRSSSRSGNRTICIGPTSNKPASTSIRRRLQLPSWFRFPPLRLPSWFRFPPLRLLPPPILLPPPLLLEQVKRKTPLLFYFEHILMFFSTNYNFDMKKSKKLSTTMYYLN